VGEFAMTEKSDIEEALDKEDFGKARRLLKTFLGSLAREPDELRWGRQKLALSTYKDKESQSETALEEALKALMGEGLPTSTDPETLGLAGAIHKRFWEITRDVQQLTKSSGYYERAHIEANREYQAAVKEGDPLKIDKHLEKWAYGTVNAAIVLDLLAAAEVNASDNRVKADGLRQEVCNRHDQILAVVNSKFAWAAREPDRIVFRSR
jgi:hypothetical protein